MQKKYFNEKLFESSLKRLNLTFDGDASQYYIFCEHIKYKFKSNVSTKIDFYLNIFLTRGITDNLIKIVDEATKINAVTLYKFKLVYGNDWGKLKWDEYKNKQAKTNSLEYKSEKYGMTKDEFYLYNKSRAITSDNLIEKYGKIDGMQIYDDYVNKQKLTKSKEYYINKHGEDAWNKLCESKSHNIENYIIRYGDYNIAVTKLEEFVSNIGANRGKFYSKISQEMFRKLDIGLEFSEKDSIFKEKNLEFTKYCNEIGGCFMYDYVIPKHKICIEFNGDYYHANPLKYSPDQYISISKKFAKDIWKFDETKNNFLRQLGFDVIVVWESDYKRDKNEKVKELVDYVNKVRNKSIHY